MVNIFKAYSYSILRGIMKFVGLRPQMIEIEPGTVIKLWAPTKTSDKPAVILLHGFAVDGMLTWQLQALSLAGQYAVYVPDFMFFGGSTTDRTEKSVAFQAQSTGGLVSFELARKCPELVESLVVPGSVMTLTESISAHFFQRMGDDGVMLSSWSDFLLPQSAKGARTKFKIATYKLPRWIPECFFRQYVEVASERRKEKAELLEALVIPDDEDPNKIPTLSQRVHLLWGANDKIFPMKVAISLKEKLGEKATLESIEGAGHVALLERPIVYNRLLRKTLASLVEAGVILAPNS
ncbi:hypothetical protein CRG98_010388 [Punica granatum]|uniref:AB hydrolase-1 domain-containing protein n=1 Tax=Punica granatum TaxID=22663 RepID=A0A2I0KL63_PUNGR|nr:hypothetical protein CRG98_010388 [Punica granatum]